MNLYYHKTDGGAEYLFDTYVECEDGHKEGVINDETLYIIRIDGDITKDAELTVRHKYATDDQTTIGALQENWESRIK
jgi:hypothetical protein